MQRIEKWRILELSHVLNQLAELMSKGNSREWANVFFHFNQESQRIVSSEKFDLDQLKKLIINIKNCFSSISSSLNLFFFLDNSEGKSEPDQELLLAKERLLKIINQMESRLVEFYH